MANPLGSFEKFWMFNAQNKTVEPNSCAPSPSGKEG
jgi:hypothetical protein